MQAAESDAETDFMLALARQNADIAGVVGWVDLASAGAADRIAALAAEPALKSLRPMLQEWLDDNLPRLVERLVREEIERVARGGRR